MARKTEKSGYWKPEFMKTFVLPGVCAAVMASVCWIIELALSQVTEEKYVTVPVSLVCGILSYFMLLLILRALTPEEMRQFPGGKLMMKVSSSDMSMPDSENAGVSCTLPAGDAATSIPPQRTVSRSSFPPRPARIT